MQKPLAPTFQILHPSVQPSASSSTITLPLGTGEGLKGEETATFPVPNSICWELPFLLRPNMSLAAGNVICSWMTLQQLLRISYQHPPRCDDAPIPRQGCLHQWMLTGISTTGRGCAQAWYRGDPWGSTISNSFPSAGMFAVWE